MPIQSVAEYYHEHTKYSPEGIQRVGRGLDFDKQPFPFKDYVEGTVIDLTRLLPEGEELGDDRDLAAWREGLSEADRPLAEVSHMLYFTYGVTAVVPYPNQPFLMRAAPSAGGLYPAEIYLVAHGHPALPDGIYNYQVRDHSLVRYWGQDAWPALKAACLDHPAFDHTDLMVVFTGVFYRSAWRYEDRAYRRVMLDTGHALGNLVLEAPWIGRHAALIGGFIDNTVNELLFLPREEEEAIAVVALLPENAKVTLPPMPGTPKRNFRETPEGQRLHAIQEAGKIQSAGEALTPPPVEEKPYPFGFGTAIPGAVIPWDGSLGPTMLKRRSTRAFTGEGLTKDELASLLEFTYRPDLYEAAGVETHPPYFVPELLQTYLAVHDVEGLESGCYHYSPQKRELRQIRFTSLRDEVRYLALGQDLAGRAGVVVFHTVDLPGAVNRYGDRVYRYLHLDAGHLGQRMNLAAIRLGLGVSGIGGFFDDQVNDLLGIPEDQAVLYITTIGRPAGTA